MRRRPHVPDGDGKKLPVLSLSFETRHKALWQIVNEEEG
jgi:hypothetical protein